MTLRLDTILDFATGIAKLVFVAFSNKLRGPLINMLFNIIHRLNSLQAHKQNHRNFQQCLKIVEKPIANDQV